LLISGAVSVYSCNESEREQRALSCVLPEEEELSAAQRSKQTMQISTHSRHTFITLNTIGTLALLTLFTLCDVASMMMWCQWWCDVIV